MRSYLGVWWVLSGLFTWKAFDLVGYTIPIVTAWLRAQRLYRDKRGGLGARAPQGDKRPPQG